MAESQLRIYDVKPGQMEAFLKVFESIPAIRRRHGFTIDGVWIDEIGDKFVWVVSYDGPATFVEATARYEADPERQEMDPPPRQFLDAVELRMMRRID